MADPHASSHALAEVFRKGLAEPERADELPPDELEQRLRAIVDSGAAAWPQVPLSPQRLVAHLAQRLGAHLDLAQELDRIAAADLYLACGCVEGIEQATVMLCQQHRSTIEAALVRLRQPALAEELTQQLMVRLFVHGERPPLITKYGGRGALRHWLKITALREGLAQLKRAKREVATDDQLLVRLVQEHDPELAQLKRVYRQQFKAAFQQALGTLTPKQRNLLRYQVVNGLTLDAIAAVYDVHRATAARWRAAARAALFKQTKQAMKQSIGTDSAAFESVMRLIQSQLDVSLARLLRLDAEQNGEGP